MANFAWRSFKQKIFPWLKQVQESDSSTEDLVELPDTLQVELAQAIKSLDTPEVYKSEIQSALDDCIEAWQQNLEASNSLVILGNPVEAIAKILGDSLQGWDNNLGIEIITPLDNFRRPYDPLVITERLQQILEDHSQINLNNREFEPSLDVKSLEKRTALVVIPSLEECFLRCISGWDGIDFLREITIQNPQYFWLIGCNCWAWNFLDFVDQIGAYFSDVRPLAVLDGEMLQSWLAPITGQFCNTPLDGDRQSSIKQGNSASPEPTEPEAYWQELAEQSEGVSSIATNLWLRSLRIKKEILEVEEPAQLTINAKESDKKTPDFYQISPNLPNLPSLTNLDLYLLHSMMIHGRITSVHLALSLGEVESQIQARIQWLIRQHILDRHQGNLTICPGHYQTLKSELANNNFFVGDK